MNCQQAHLTITTREFALQQAQEEASQLTEVIGKLNTTLTDLQQVTAESKHSLDKLQNRQSLMPKLEGLTQSAFNFFNEHPKETAIASATVATMSIALSYFN